MKISGIGFELARLSHLCHGGYGEYREYVPDESEDAHDRDGDALAVELEPAQEGGVGGVGGTALGRHHRRVPVEIVLLLLPLAAVGIGGDVRHGPVF